MTIQLIVTIRMKEDVSEAYKQLAVESQKEAGCKRYSLLRAATKQDTLYIVEEWESDEHLKAHTQTAHYKGMAALADKVEATLDRVETLV